MVEVLFEKFKKTRQNLKFYENSLFYKHLTWFTKSMPKTKCILT